MKSSTKVFAILSLASAAGQMIVKSGIDDTTKWRGEKLYESGLNAVGAYPFPILTKSKIRQIERKIEDVCKPGEDISVVEILSFLVCGLIDIRSKTKKENWRHIDPVLKRAVWCQEKFDPKYELEDAHAKAYSDYCAWVG